MAKRHVLRSVPGVLGTLLLIVAVTTASISGLSSLFYEGWGQPALHSARYAAPAVVMLVLGLVALSRPAVGGLLLLVTALAAGSWWMYWQLGRDLAPRAVLLVTAVMMTGPVVVAALCFLFEARHRRLLRMEGASQSPHWLMRHWGAVLLIAVPAASVAVLSAGQLPALLARHDDGQRGARVIPGNGIRLMWAPQGPGWNWESDGVSWDSLMHHGGTPQDRCAYLDDAGTTLLAAAPGLWRMPSADELVRSLTRNGTNAGCTWDGRSPHAECATPPDKETPLWAPDQVPIYYWSSQTAGSTQALAVNYTGGISPLPRSRPVGAIGFRCVRSVGADRSR